MTAPAFTLTVEQLKALIREAVRQELAGASEQQQSDVLLREEAAAILKIHPKTLTKYAEQKKIRASKIGRDWRFRRADVMAFLQNGKAA